MCRYHSELAQSKYSVILLFLVLFTNYLNFAHSEACGNYGLNCPLKSSEVSKFALQLPIKKIYPPVSVDVQVALVDDNKKNLVCVIFHAKIED